MSAPPLVSIIVDNYNYGRFLGQAIESALDQAYPRTEVIVVDDGSTDNSREVISRYGSRIVPVLQDNRGQAAAFNQGFRHCQGEVVLFLDSDDALLPTAATRAVEALREPHIIKAHWPLHIVDEQGGRTGKISPAHDLAEGDLRQEVLKGGPWCVATPPTTGNAWTRRFLEEVLPVPEERYRICADAFLVALGWVCGPSRLVPEPQGLYRLHGSNRYAAQPFLQKLKRDLWVHDQVCDALDDYFSREGIAIDREKWRRESWPHQLFQVTQELPAVVPEGETLILVDGDDWGVRISEKLRQLPFLEKNGDYWGPPADDATAMSELTRMQKEYGAGFIAFGWPAFWWLDHYREFARHLRENFRCVLHNERLRVFDLRLPLPSDGSGPG
jgi:glycosyltransferase involved in cell wall biosynthesis